MRERQGRGKGEARRDKGGAREGGKGGAREGGKGEREGRGAEGWRVGEEGKRKSRKRSHII